MEKSDELVCGFCENKMKEDDEYCMNCGHLFVDDALCNNHEEADAEGVCIICSYAFCGECGSYKMGRFLCNEHADYEIVGSYARVFGSTNLAEVDYYKNILLEEKMHPVLLDKKNNAISFAGNEYSFFKHPQKQSAVIMNEVKLLVPLTETLDAEAIIANIKKEGSED